MPLSPRQQLFVQEYLVDLNGTAAAARAGYAPCACSSSASRMLRKKEVAEAIGRAMDERAREARISVRAVLDELAHVAFFDPGQLVDAGGAILPLHEMSREARAGLGAVELVEFAATARRPASRQLKARPGEKVRALMGLLARLGLEASLERRRAGGGGARAEDQTAGDEIRARIDAVGSFDANAWSDPAQAADIAHRLVAALARRREDEQAAREGGAPAAPPPQEWAWISRLMSVLRQYGELPPPGGAAAVEGRRYWWGGKWQAEPPPPADPRGGRQAPWVGYEEG